MNTMYIFFADGFEEIEAITAVDILRRAGLVVKTISVTRNKTVTGAHEIPVVCDKTFEECDFTDADMLLLPGGTPGAYTLDAHEGLRQLILDFAGNNKPIAAICAAPLILGKLGLLVGRKATCYPGFEKYLEGAECSGEQTVKADNIITARGPGASIEFALSVVEMAIGKGKAEEVAAAMCVKKH